MMAYDSVIVSYNTELLTAGLAIILIIGTQLKELNYGIITCNLDLEMPEWVSMEATVRTGRL